MTNSTSTPLISVNRRRITKTVDTMAYVVGVGGNIAIVPQIIKAWGNEAPGLAVMTWILFIGIGSVWLAYAILHRQKPLIIANSIGVFCSTAVVLGWLLHN